MHFVHAQECTAEISVQTNNPSSIIYLNNEPAGTGSITKEVKEGTYILYVVKDSLTWNRESFRDSFVVSDCSDNKSFNYTFNNKIYLRTDPPDSYVYDGDSLLGHTPLMLTPVFNSLRLDKPGYKPQIISQDDMTGNRVFQLEYLGQKKDVPFIEKDVFKILVGSAALLGGITAYFKLKADDYFEDYEFTGNQDLLDKTRKYDLISGLTFGALQINFGILIYYFLIED
ncbi:MAG: hypothetical protein R6W90_15525 [Ignavibacteriaceae bacterium]